MASFRTLPMGRRPVTSRVVALFRPPLEEVEALLPDGARPRTVRGHAIASLCFSRHESQRRFFSAAPFDHLAWRVAAEFDGAPGSWVLQRKTSSWIEARCSALLAGPCARARFELDESPTHVTVRVTHAKGEDLYLRALAAPRLEGSVFRSAREVEAFLTEPAGALPRDPFAPTADTLGTAALAAEPLAVVELRTTSALLPFGDAELDSAFRIVSRRLDPLRGKPRPATEPVASPALG